MGQSTISMAIFNSYVSLPEGNRNHHHDFAFIPRAALVYALNDIPYFGLKLCPCYMPFRLVTIIIIPHNEVTVGNNHR